MGLEDIIAQNATSVQQNIQRQQQDGGMTTLGPAPLIQPPPPVKFQPPQMQRPQAGNEFSTVSGNKRATKQAMFSNIASMIKSGGDYIQAKKTRALQSDIERLMGAQQGLEEARTALQQNPNDPRAKEAFDTNNGIISDIKHDPKKVKQLEKAFNIDLFGSGKNKQENQALQAAWKTYDEKIKAGDRTAQNPISSMMPQRQQMSPQAQQQAMAIKLGMQPDANAKLQDLAKTSDRIASIQMEKMREANDLKIAEMAAGKIGGEGVNVVDTSGDSLTGVMRLQMSANGQNIRRTPNVVLPSILPSEHEGISTLVVADPNSPTGQSIARIPNPSSTQRQIPGVGTVGAGGMIQRSGQQQPQVQRNQGQGQARPSQSIQVPGHTATGAQQATKLGLPKGSTIISPKALSTAQVAKFEEGITAMEGTIDRLKELRANTDIYSDMYSAGKVKLSTDPRTGKRILAGFIPSTDEEKRAAASWQESAEYMNSFRQALNAQGFRSIPAYDNMLALRGQLWQDKVILNKTLDDSISFMQKEIGTKKKLLGQAPTVDERKQQEDKDNPAGLKF